MVDQTMTDKKIKKWHFIFHQFGKEDLGEMLFKAAMKKKEEGRVIIEFDGNKAMEITEHVAEMEDQLE
jgi:hypothetical protein